MIAISAISRILLPLVLAPTADPASCQGATGCQITIENKTCSMKPSSGEGVSIWVDPKDSRLLEVLVAGEPMAEKRPNEKGFRDYPYTEGEWGVTLKSKKSGPSVKCEIFTLKPASDPKVATGSPSSDAFDVKVAKAASAARKWLKSEGITDHEVLDEDSGLRKRPAWGRRIKLYFLPDGRAAFPIPDDLEETDILTLAMVVPSGSGVNVEVLNCPTVQLGRVRGSFGDASDALVPKSDAAEFDPAAWGIVETGEFRCSEELEVSIQNHIPTKSKSGAQQILEAKGEVDIPLDEVFFLTVGVGLVVDLGRPTVTSLHDRPIEGMPMATQKYVAQRNDFTGLRPVITLGAHPCGANPRSWRACDVFSPTLVIDPTRIRDGFGLGLNLTAPWFGILLAANMYKSEVLTKGTNIEVGDVWTAPGDLPTSKVFDRNSFGMFIGVSMTTDLFRAVVGRKK